jgi:hypothetical protein
MSSVWSGIRRHLSYANVTATLALVFAMSGGALAAKHYLINSTGQINPKVLKKLRGTTGPPGLTGIEGPTGPSGPTGLSGRAGLSGPAGLNGLNGPAGLSGPTGLGGPTGPTGPSSSVGASKAFNTNSGSETLDFPSVTDQNLTVASLSLPAGSFSVVGKLIADNDDWEKRPIARCELLLGKSAIDPGFSGVSLGKGGPEPEGDRHYMVLAGTGSLSSPGTAEIVCRVAGTSGKYMDRSITAIQVGSLGP